MEKGVWEIISDSFADAIDAALTQYGPGVVLLILAIIGLFVVHERLWLSRIRDKDREIARIAAKRDHYETLLLKKRIGANIDQDGNPLGE